MNIGVFVEYDDNFSQVAALTLPVIQEYCNRHGYTLVLRQNPKMDHNRGIIWDRVQILLKHLNDYDWLVHMDADVLITNLNVPLSEFVSHNSNIIISTNRREDGSIHLNDGVLFVKGSVESREILNQVWECNSDSVLCAQDAFERLSDVIWSMRIEPQKRFNSFLYQEYGMPTNTKGQWTKGDFILHTPGITMKRRLEIIPTIEIIR